MVEPSPGALASLRIYTRPRMLSMLALGFSSGLPYMLVYSTLSAWLSQLGIARSTVAMLSWVSLAYSFKFVWSPVVDRVRLPLLGRWLGQRRSWMMLAQLSVAAALLAISSSDPKPQVLEVASCALWLAFSAATQDIAIDAWRIESAPVREQGAMAAAYQLGYRLAILVASFGALWIAADLGWARSYATMAALVSIGLITTLVVREPERIAPPVSVLTERRVIDWLEHRSHWPDWARHTGAWILGAVICPIIDFFARYGLSLGLLLFAFISTYRLTDFTMGVMANRFYLDTGFSLKQIAAVAKLFGTVWSILGILVGGFAVARFGRLRSLLLGSVLIMISNIAYSILAARSEASVPGLAAVISLDNFAQGVHGTALIAFMSSLTSASFTATQYAVLSSLYSLLPKLLMGASGRVVDAIGYPSFYLYTASLSIPALVLLLLLARRRDFQSLRTPSATPASSGGS
jgi:MFS transporter, PAT family, beta-lactamase induction signal transducer AmpG